MTSPVFPTPYTSGFRLHSGDGMNATQDADVVSSWDSMVANGTTRATATQIVTVVANFGTVGASGQAILPPAIPGTRVWLYNNGANTLTVLGFLTSDTIDGGANQTLSTANRAAVVVCTAAGKWISGLLGAVMS